MKQIRYVDLRSDPDVECQVRIVEQVEVAAGRGGTWVHASFLEDEARFVFGNVGEDG